MFGIFNAGTNVIAMVALAGVVTTAALWHRGEVQRGVQQGAAVERTKTERANDEVIQRAARVRSSVRDERVRGVVDPNNID
jgi:Flp pilus assembly protein TadB